MQRYALAASPARQHPRLRSTSHFQLRGAFNADDTCILAATDWPIVDSVEDFPAVESVASLVLEVPEASAGVIELGGLMVLNDWVEDEEEAPRSIAIRSATLEPVVAMYSIRTINSWDKHTRTHGRPLARVG